ncbi:hypothetical protein [Actinacidiphila acidipaludis]|uniref:Secreted protein n=1 Tax=Actinacidiphila acidipaludis TaxID=2873382 RepID=A0ABS7Q508_9ACTN|nr:hypothetical protein [Streptomyces acidipaludis]MBY8878187.1 hypothetical protein [Streptomyces acidipaludis]
MNVKWGSLGGVAVVGFGVTVGVVVIFALGVRALAARDERKAAGSDGTALTVGAGACFAVCAAAVAYGLYLIIPQFH